MSKQLIEDPEEIRLREEQEIRQLMGDPPPWLNKGVSVVGIAVAALILIGYFMRYPDVVIAQATLLTENPPIRLVARVSGKLTELLVEDNDPVQRGELLGMLETPAEREDVETLERLLDTVEVAIREKEIGLINFPVQLSLEEGMQNAYALLTQHFQDQHYRLTSDQAALRIAVLKQQQGNIEKLNRSIADQIQTLEEEVAIAKKIMDQYLVLLKNDNASESEFNDKRTVYLRYSREWKAKQTELINNQLAIDRLDDQILSLRQEEDHQIAEGWTSLQADLQRLKSDIAAWQQDYLLTAPIDGRVALTEVRNSNQFVRAGENVLAVVPPDGSDEIIALAMAPAAGLGKVETGQTAQLRLAGYPYKEFGAVEGVVANIAAVPDQMDARAGQFQIRINLPDAVQRGDTLYTSHGKAIRFRQEMAATARIITKDRSLLARIWERVRGVGE